MPETIEPRPTVNVLPLVYLLLVLGAVAVTVGIFAIGLPDPHLSIRNHHIQHVFFILGGGLYGLALAMGLTANKPGKAWPGRGVWLAPALLASLVVMVAMWPSTYSVIEANPTLHALQHGFYIVASAVATFCAYYFARSAGWIVGGMQVVMAWAAAFGFGVNPGPSPLIAQVAAMPAVASGGSGAAAYQNCVACHMADGGGMPGVFPPLAGHVPALLAADGGQEYMVRVVLYGLQGQITAAGSSYAGAMPGWGHLSDDDLAAALNHVSSTWGELPATASAPFSAADVQAARGTQLTPQQVHELREGLGLP